MQTFSVGYSSSTFYIMAVFPVVTGAALLYTGTQLAPAPLWYGLGVVVLLVGIALAYNGYATNHITLRVTRDGLIIGAPWRERSLARSEMKLDEAKRVDPNVDGGYLPVKRKNGSDVNGLKEGWWLLQSGEKALVVLTKAENAVYIPTNAGYSILVSPTDPDGFLSALKALQREARGAI